MGTNTKARCCAIRPSLHEQPGGRRHGTGKAGNWRIYGRALILENISSRRGVAFVGEPNVGKSSLLNALLRFGRAIVHDQPGTTRDLVSGLTACDGWPVQLIDTAGLGETSEPIERAGVALTTEMLAEADLVLWVRRRRVAASRRSDFTPPAGA